MKVEIIEIIKEEDFEYYGLEEKKGHDLINIQKENFNQSPGRLTMLFRKLLEPIYVKKPHNFKLGDVCELNGKNLIKK